MRYDVTDWDPPHRLAYRGDPLESGEFHAFEFLVEGRAGSSTVVRVVHSGALANWDDEFEAMSEGDALYWQQARLLRRPLRRRDRAVRAAPGRAAGIPRRGHGAAARAARAGRRRRGGRPRTGHARRARAARRRRRLRDAGARSASAPTTGWPGSSTPWAWSSSRSTATAAASCATGRAGSTGSRRDGGPQGVARPGGPLGPVPADGDGPRGPRPRGPRAVRRPAAERDGAAVDHRHLRLPDRRRRC